MKKLRVGVVGVGFIGTAHVEALRRLGYVDVVAVADQNGGAKRAEALFVEHGYNDYREMIEKENLDAIVMEFKVQNTSKEKSLEETVEHALRQIQEKQYDTELLARGITKERIRHYGFAFRGKKVLIGN